jgi:hypothetical protein
MAQVAQVEPVQVKERLTNPVSFRLREKERTEVEELAEEFDVSLSDAARMIFRRGLKDKPRLAV